MDVNGESMGRRWQKGIHVQELIIVAQWRLVAQFVSKYTIYSFYLPTFLWKLILLVFGKRFMLIQLKLRIM